MESTALFSSDRKHRYCLGRVWDPRKPLCLFIGLNPSRADGIRDDPTIVKCMGLASRWGYGGFYICNLYSLITPYPERLFREVDPVGEDADKWIHEKARECAAIVLCWGSCGQVNKTIKLNIAHRSRILVDQLPRNKLHHTGLTKDGQPRHPLYLPYGTALQAYQGKIAT